MKSARGARSWWSGVVAAVVLALAGVHGCGRPTPANRAHSGADAAPGTGGAPAGSGGGMEGIDPDEGRPDARATGGAGGKLDAGRTGGAGGTGGRADAGSGGAGGSLEPDAAVPTGGTSGSGGAPADASAGTGGAGGQAGSGGTGGTSGTGGQGPPDAALPPPTSGTAACHPDPKVIQICKQLEPACLNCPDRSIWDACFRLSAAGDDEACARYAVDNDCTVDQGGNWCGSLNCEAQGCPRTSCLQAQGNGVSGTCQTLLDECPCQ